MARVTAISGLGAKGPACFLVETADARLLLDLGYGPQPGLLPDVERVGNVDALVLSHGHRDHAGGLSLLPRIGNPPVYATDIVRRMLPPDTNTRPIPLNGATEVMGLTVTTGRNGHAPGGVWLHIGAAGGLLYMGDNCTESMLYAQDAPPAAEVLILDASYGEYETPLAAVQTRFERLSDAGPVLLPVPVAGRGPEIALHVMRSGRGMPHIDDAMRGSLEKLATTDGESLKPGLAAAMAELARLAPPIREPRGIMLAGAADATSGRAASLVAAWEKMAQPAIVFTGYLPPGTPAQRLTDNRRASYLRWNVHPLLSHNAELAARVGARIVLPAFGDSARHAQTWARTFAPARVTTSRSVEW
jgi:Cft2 family RNA processing exonuclease